MLIGRTHVDLAVCETPLRATSKVQVWSDKFLERDAATKV